MKGYCRQGVGMVLDKKPASAGFLLGVGKCEMSSLMSTEMLKPYH